MNHGADGDGGIRRRAGLAGVVVFVLAHAVYVAWPWSIRPFWQDECKHNYAILDAASIPAMVAAVGSMSQPALDHLLRRLVWFPLFGHQEFGLRLPSLVYYVAMLLGGIAITARFLERRGHATGYVLFGALLAGLWMTTKPAEPWNAFEARHYALVSLCSMWWVTLAVLVDRPAPWVWWTATVLFANAHFFALPLIAVVSLLDAREAWIAGRRGAGLGVLAGAAAVALLTIGMNAPAWNMLTHSPPGSRVAWTAGLAAGGRTWWEFVRYGFKAGVPVVAVWAGLVGATERRDNRRLLACCLVFMPLFLTALRLKSDYPFSGRYFTPFFGLAFATLLLGLDQGPRCVDAVAARWRLAAGPARALRGACLAGLFLLFQVGAAGLHLARLPRRWVRVAQNGSPTFHMYEAIKRADRPVLIISETCWSELTHRLYFRFIGAPLSRPVRLLRARPCEGEPAQVPGEVERFLAAEPGALVVLDQTDTGDEVCDGPAAARAAPGVTVRRAGDDVCAWLVEGARSAADVRRAAGAVGFRSLRWWFRP